MLRSLSVGFETLRANPLRTILSTLGIVIGVAALVSVLSVGDGMERLARREIGRTTDLQRIAIASRLVRIVDGPPFPLEKARETRRLRCHVAPGNPRRLDQSEFDGYGIRNRNLTTRHGAARDPGAGHDAARPDDE